MVEVPAAHPHVPKSGRPFWWSTVPPVQRWSGSFDRNAWPPMGRVSWQSTQGVMATARAPWKGLPRRTIQTDRFTGQHGAGGILEQKWGGSIPNRRHVVVLQLG